jgi:purine-binding chemotaxis protein CheW
MSDARADGEPFVLFELAGTTYALPSLDIQQMEMIEHLTPVPNAPACVAGVVFLRGQVVPAVDLRTRFGFPRVPYSLRTRLIVVMAGGRRVGLIADTASEFVRIPAGAIQPPPEGVSGDSSRYVRGVALLGERVVLILDAQAAIGHLDDRDLAVTAAA